MNIMRDRLLCDIMRYRLFCDMLRSRFLRLILPLSVFFIFCSCGSDDDPQPVEPTPPTTATRTVLVYMVADNTLGTNWGCDDADIREMLEGVKGGTLNGGRLLVYHNRPKTASGNPPQMLEITEQGLKVLKTYPDDASIYSVDPERISEVMADMKAVAPAEDYGLVLWSHANGWLGGTSENDNRYRAFGDDRGYHISVQTLARTLADEHFSFIYFDCCLMGNVETIYELRHITDFIVASPTELSIDGMPYERNVPEMFASGKSVEDAMVNMAENTYKYYEADENGMDDGCQIAVYKLSELEGLAAVTRPIFETVTEYSPLATQIQRYNKPYDSGYVYDMENLMELYTTTMHPKKEGEDADNGEYEHYLGLLDAWKAQWRRLVVYGAATRHGIGGLYIDRYCGLGTFAIDQPVDIVWRGYNTLQWWKDVVSVCPAFQPKQ